MPRRRWILVVVAALVAVTATTAYARTVPLTPKKLFAAKQSAVDAMPTTLVTDSFATSNTNLDGKASDGPGPVWAVPVGGLKTVLGGGSLRCSTCTGGAYGAGFVDAFRGNVTVSAQLLRPTDGGTSGIVVNSDQNLAHAIVVWWTGAQLEISKYVGGALSTLATKTVANVPTSTFVTLKVVVSNGTYNVSFNNVSSTLSYTLKAADGPSSFVGNTFTGVLFLDDDNNDRLDSFLVTK